MDKDSWDERHRGPDLPGRDRLGTREPNRFLVRTLQDVPPGAALVLACGQGRNAVWLAQRGWTVTGIDWSGVALEQAAALAAAQGVAAEWIEADLLEWEPSGGYDLVTVLYLQIPASERHVVWRKAATSVAEGGRLLMVGHDSRNLEEGYGGPSSATVLYTASEAAQVLGEVLDVERAETVVRPVEVEDGVRYAVDNLVLAVRS